VRRVAALESALEARYPGTQGFADAHVRTAEEDWVPQNGARVVAKAWIDPAFKQRLLEKAKAAVADPGLSMPPYHRRLVAPANSAKLHKLIVCTQCSCTA